MILQKLHNYKILSVKSNFLLKRYVQKYALNQVNTESVGFGSLPKKKPRRDSYLKSLMLGHIDEEMCTYPILLSPRYENYIAWLKPIESYVLSCINKNLDKNEVLCKLRELNLFQAHIDEKYLDTNLCTLELMKLIETVSNLPWLGTYMIKNHLLPIQLICNYGSENQKFEYYPKIMNGELIPSICVYEHGQGTNINNFETYAIQHSEDSWLLNGKKQYVVNGINSNLFLVYAKHILPKVKQTMTNSFSLFLVEKDFGNVTCTDVYDTIGKHETPMCTINFTNTIIPNKNIIGAPGSAFKSLLEILKPGTLTVTGQAISVLKNFINQLVPNILEMKHYDREFYQFDVVKEIIAKITITLYTMESMTYLTAGMIDKYDDMNANVEVAITETYCINKCLKCIQEGLQLLSVHSYMNNNSYTQAFHDAMAISILNTKNIDTYTYVGATMIQYIAKTIQDHVYKKRNFIKFPLYNISDTIFKNFAQKLHIEEYVHPSLSTAAVCLEKLIDKVKEGLTFLLEHNGSQAIEQYADLYKVSEMLTEIYALYANLIRASNSYSISTRTGDLEIQFVTTSIIQSYNKVCAIVTNVEYAPLLNNYNYSDIMGSVYENRKYVMEHPLHKTF